ncbi:thiamine phosphate synthase [Alicyclobacillus tolerans]|uniref:Thiamine-phosphate synthase n=1 Tax=Alicyclobacillus tolerans TaxID=90970 RepID=A0A1M6QQH4_9BACL|nr:thiamine phosphate synthase [Alicyclobacillus montanus]SHK22532.1 thiamine-phosphate diphosphorylase [Alicyclobacillus montanus]
MKLAQMTKEELRRRLRLYVVTDERKDTQSLLDTTAAAIQGGATAIQLRRKADLGRHFVDLAYAIRRMTREADVLFFVNDRVDIALLCDADGIHVGQDDLSCMEVKKLFPDALVGVSAAGVEEALAAEQQGADYLGVGAVYPTNSKPDADFTGLEGLSLVTQSVSLPVVAIGGINVERASSVLKAGADGIAVVSAVMSADDPRMASMELIHRMEISGG